MLTCEIDDVFWFKTQAVDSAGASHRPTIGSVAGSLEQRVELEMPSMTSEPECHVHKAPRLPSCQEFTIDPRVLQMGRLVLGSVPAVWEHQASV